MSRRVLLACLMSALLNTSVARAQLPFARDLIPSRTALGRLGLEQHWMMAVPLARGERLNVISLAGGMMFAQTNLGNFHALEAETGRLSWSASLGAQAAKTQPASVNSKSVFVTNLNKLYRLDRKTGHTIWTKEMDTLASSATSCTDDCVMVGLDNGKVYAYGLKTLDEEKNLIDDRAVEIWNWQTGGVVDTRPIVTDTMAFFGSDDGKLYVSLAKERTLLYRISTGGAIGSGFGTYGNRLIIVPSADRKLYGIDIFEPKIVWVHPTGAPVSQQPLVADDDVYVVNSLGELSSVEPKTGSPKWTTSTLGGRLIAVGAKRIYLESHDEDLFIVDRETGKIVADPSETRIRAGVNFRSFNLGITNESNDRIYVGTSSGLVLCLRELGEVNPRPLKDPKSEPFTFVPVQGLPRVVPVAKPAEDGTVPASPTEPPAESPTEPPAEPPMEGEPK